MREMVNVVVADIAGEPIQEARQVVVGAARERGLLVDPASRTASKVGDRPEARH